MEIEYNIIKKSIKEPEIFICGNYTFAKGFINGYPVIAVKTLMGSVNAAGAATLCIERFNPFCIIVSGTAGAHHKDLHTGDIVLGKNIVCISSYISKIRKSGQGVNLEKRKFFNAEFLVENNIKRLKLHSDKSLIKAAKSVPYKSGKVYEGTIGSGDVWNRELDFVKFLHNNLETDCEEMEGYSVAQICRMFNVPMLDIRIISNNELNGEHFNKTSCALCQNFCIETVKKIIDNL